MNTFMPRRAGKIFIVTASILLLAVSCHKQPPQLPPAQNSPAQNPTPAQDPTANWNSYTSPTKIGFFIKYPGDFGFNTNLKQIPLSYIPICDAKMVACLFLTGDAYEGTNFEGAGISINTDPGLNTEAKCYNFKVSTNEAQTQVADVTINNVVFKSATGGSGAAGHFGKVQVYRKFNNNSCYELDQRVLSTNIGNYPEGAIKEFNQDEVWQKLQNVINTFELTR